MDDKKLLRNGVIGTSIAALCCFTPVLVILLGFAGLSGIIGGLDYFLFPMMFASMGFVSIALFRRSGNKGPSPKNAIVVLVIALSSLLFWLEFRYALRISLAAAALVATYGFYLRSLTNRTAA
ncbi:MAG: mercury resistance system transport protein MerF [Gammaproteobacteria bacterium]|nr:MAG: mercury resistance system transport protein MerF [Gammaproteobacteria bacterium]